MEQYTFKNTFNQFFNSIAQTNLIAAIVTFVLLCNNALRALDLYLSDTGDTSTLLNHYGENWIIYWIILFFSAAYTLLMPLLKIKKKPFGSYIYWFGMGTIGLSFVILITLTVSDFYNKSSNLDNNDTLTVLGIVIAVVTAGFGWFIQHQLTRQHNKINHSLNLILQMRVSEEFQKNTTKLNYYKTQISPEDAAHYANIDISAIDPSSNDAKLFSTLRAHYYVLNYYEFLAFGADSGSLDDEILYQTIGGPVIRTVKKCEHLIAEARSHSNKCFQHLQELEGRWRLRHTYESEHNSN